VVIKHSKKGVSTIGSPQGKRGRVSPTSLHQGERTPSALFFREENCLSPSKKKGGSCRSTFFSSRMNGRSPGLLLGESSLSRKRMYVMPDGGGGSLFSFPSSRRRKGRPGCRKARILNVTREKQTRCIDITRRKGGGRWRPCRGQKRMLIAAST